MNYTAVGLTHVKRGALAKELVAQEIRIFSAPGADIGRKTSGY